MDADLVLQAMIDFAVYDKAIIIAGDGDYYSLIDYLNKKDKLMYVLIPNKIQFSRLLRPYMKNIIFIEDLKHSLMK